MKNYVEIKFDCGEIVAIVKKEDVATLFDLVTQEDGNNYFDISDTMRFLVDLGMTGRAHMDYLRGDIYAQMVDADKPSIKYDWSDYGDSVTFFEDNEGYYIFSEVFNWI